MGLIVSEGDKPMMVGRGRPAGTAKSSHLNLHTGDERARWEWYIVLKSQNLPLVKHLLQQGHTSFTLP